MASQLSAMTGMSMDEATIYLEMAGGSIEMAIDLFFNSQAEPGAQESCNTKKSEKSNWPSCFTLLWSGTLNEAWLIQTISFSNKIGEEIGLIQHKNGPCGVLAVIQALLIAARLETSNFAIDVSTPFSDKEITTCLARIIQNCADAAQEVSPCSICLWENNQQNEHETKVIRCSIEQLESIISQNLEQYKGPGGILLLLFSCVLTRGEENVKKDALAFGELPLLYGPHFLCTSEVIMLLLTGKANGSVGAYSPDGIKRVGDLNVIGGVGLLSYQAYEAGIPVHDSLKSPQLPVWILHSGDHFTVSFQLEKNNNTPPIELYHWNGLPPGGPRMSSLSVRGEFVVLSAPPVSKESYCKPIPGEIEDIIQACPVDNEKHPEQWTKWNYEIVLASVDDTVSGPVRSIDENPPEIFEQGEPGDGEWRCSSCYRTRFATMCFGSNPSGSSVCQHCGKQKVQCGWSIWLNYSSLPKKWQKTMDRRYAPKIISILHTKWPSATITLLKSSNDSKSLPSV